MQARVLSLLVTLLVALASYFTSVASDRSLEAHAQAVPEGRHVETPGRTGYPLPRFASLRPNEVNLRAGPGRNYPIQWVYHRANQPVEIIDEFETWRQIRDWEGTVGWVYAPMLQGRRTARIEQQRSLMSDPENDAQVVAILMPGAIGFIESCSGEWCELSFGPIVGWLPKVFFYGAYRGEEIN